MMIKPSSSHLIAIDPGLRAAGVAVVAFDGRLVDAAVWTVPAHLARRAAERELIGRFNALLIRYPARTLAIEETYPTTNRSLAPVHRVARLFVQRAVRRGIHVTPISSSSARRRLLGNGRAGKRDVGRFCATLYPELRVYLNQRGSWQERHFGNLFDAVLLAIDGLQRRAEVDAQHRTPRHRYRWFPFRLGLGTGRGVRRDPEARPRT